MRKICLVDFDMSVTGGVEQVTSELLNELCKNYEVYLSLDFLQKLSTYIVIMEA